MPMVEVDVGVWCDCGEGPCNQSTFYSSGNRRELHVTPCKKCIDAAYEEGYEKGYADGRREAE